MSPGPLLPREALPCLPKLSRNLPDSYYRWPANVGRRRVATCQLAPRDAEEQLRCGLVLGQLGGERFPLAAGSTPPTSNRSLRIGLDTAAPAPVYFRNRISTGAPVCTTSPAGVSPGSATAPTSNQILGIVNATNGVAGATNAVTLFGPGIIGVSAGGTSITGTTLSAGTNVTTSGTISGSAVLYVCTDGISVTLPAATTKGQIVILIDGSTTVSDGITPVAGSGDSLRGASGGGDSAGASFFFVSDGNHHWVNVGPQ